MDALLVGALQSLPQLGVMGGLGWLLLVLIRREASTDERHQTELRAVAERHTAELERINTAHDDELAELRRDLAAERQHRRELDAELRERRGGAT